MVRVFVEGTQRGYAVGTRRAGRTIREVHFRDDGTSAGIDRAYREASSFAAGLTETIKRRPDIARRQGWFGGAR